MMMKVQFGFEAPDARDAVGVAVAHLEHVDAVVDDPHDRRADDDAEDRALAAAQRAAAEHGGRDGVELVGDADLLGHLADVGGVADAGDAGRGRPRST